MNFFDFNDVYEYMKIFHFRISALILFLSIRDLWWCLKTGGGALLGDQRWNIFGKNDVDKIAYQPS